MFTLQLTPQQAETCYFVVINGSKQEGQTNTKSSEAFCQVTLDFDQFEDKSEVKIIQREIFLNLSVIL